MNYTEVTEAEKAQLRPLILGSLVTPILPVRNLLEDALRTIVTADYPKNWPGLGEEIMGALTSNSQEYVLAALVALRSVLRRYDRVDVLDREEHFAVAEGAFPVLKNLMDYLMANDSAQSQEVQLMVLKCLWDGTTYGLPPHMLDHTVFDSWMSILAGIFSQQVPGDPASMDAHQRHKLPWWTTKKWVFFLWTRFCSRFIRKNAANKNDDPAFKEWFAQTYPPLFLEKTFEGLQTFSTAGWPNRLLTSLLDFLHTSLTFATLWVHIKPHVWDIVKGVFLPLLSFNEDDFHTFEYEPELYIANQLDPLVDETNPRTPALTFIHELIARRDPEWIQELMAWINHDLLGPYYQAAPQARAALEPTFYAGLDIIGNCSDVLRKSEAFKDTLEELMATFVTPALYEGPAFLRAKACWVFSRFLRITYNDPENFINGLNGMLKNLLEATELPLVAEAAVGLFDAIPNDIARPILGPQVPVLVEKYLSLIAVVDCDAIVGSLQYLMRYYPNPVKKSAAGLMANLNQAFFRTYNKSASLTDGDDTESHNAYMAASQTIRAIHTLYKTIRKSPQLYATLEPFVVPILEVTLGRDGNSYIEDALGLMTELTYFLPAPFSPAMWKIFELLCQAYMTFAPDYMQTILPSLDNYISRDKETFLTPGAPYLDQICAMAQKYFVDPKYPELDLLPLTRVFEVLLLEHVGSIDHIIEPLIKLTVERIQMGGSSPIKVILIELIMNCMWYNASITCQVLEANNWSASIFKMMFDLIVDDEFQRVCDKKTASLGIGAMLRLPFASLPAYVQEKFLEIVTTWMQLTQHAEDQRIEEMAEDEDDDEEWGEEEEEEGEYEEDGEDGEEDWGKALDSDDDEGSDDEAMLQSLIAQMKAEMEEPDVLDNDDLDALARQDEISRPIGDDDDIPDAVGHPQLDDETVDKYIGYQWMLKGQEASDELPTDSVDEIVFLAETLHHLDAQVKDQLLGAFEQEVMDLYNQLNEVANDRMEKQAFEAEKAARKAEKNAELAQFYYSRKHQ
jgi:hypothetical protein